MNEVITHEEWLAELERVSALRRPDDPGWTVAEWATQMNCSNKLAGERLKLAKASGRLCHGKRAAESLNGRRIWSDVYSLRPVE
jgi:hypothetical protein